METSPSTSIYFTDLQDYPDLSMERKLELEQLARQGDKQAKQQLIESALRYTAHIAAHYIATYPLRHDTYLDLCQIGNLALVESFERALKANSISGYLRGTVKRVIRQYCLYRSSMIRVPTHEEYIGTFQVDSLDAALGGSDLTYQEVLAALNEIEEEEEGHHGSYEALYGPLHEAIAQLTEKQREVVKRSYGLDGEEPESLYEISARLHLPNNGAWARLRLAKKRLRTLLAERA